ncbi:alpha/beta hydrolase family protein [Methylobacterium brachiatum]|uniref:alpha/beta hydrolase family protein n=1 Tax=Methylobacterium brachiatum TaxID=269660 RepID=UPI0008F00E2B|nr:dienelactone hydrolase [Methylobacterium brachiatum]SFI74988.1 Predicted dienelactone hydrolase [Methylobacterium brachiatum]
MRLCLLLIIAIFSFAATAVEAAGFQTFSVPSDPGGPALEAAMWSPCASAAKDIKLGSSVIPGVRDCPIAGQNLPLIVVSHGFGGSYLGHRDTAETLADAGFIVVAINHPDDAYTNEARFRDYWALISRPSDVRRLIDFLLGPASGPARIDPNRIGFFGFSRGGYTGLVLGGGQPNFRAWFSPCTGSNAERCTHGSLDVWSIHSLVHDTRVKAIVIADPLSKMFPTSDSLRFISVPVQLWGSQFGGDGVFPEDVATIARNLPGKSEFHIVPRAAHFAFIRPCPDELKKSQPNICVDDASFDRVAFHRDFNQRVLTFFRQQLGVGERP